MTKGARLGCVIAAIRILTSGHPALTAEISGIPRIVDGDTVQIGADVIRLHGIDAPETDQLCLDAKGKRWACGIEARDQLVKHAGGQTWSCKASSQDRYGRFLGTCKLGNEDLERWMVQGGWAVSFVRYSHAYDADEAIARRSRAGLWAGSFIAPWDWRARNGKTVVLGAAKVPLNAQSILLGAASAGTAPSPSCTIKGNVNAGGECIYHVPGGRFYAKVNMDLSKGKRWFCTEPEAEAAGCRKSKI